MEPEARNRELGKKGLKQTPNAERRTEIKWLRVLEEHANEYRANGKTPNAQRSTSNAQRQQVRFDLEERLLAFSAGIIEIVDALPNTRAANHIAGQLLRCGT